MPRCLTCGRRWEGSHTQCSLGTSPTEAVAAPPESSAVPELLLSGYQAERLIARGGFGTVLAGRRLSDGLPVAIKVAHAGNAVAQEQLQRETRTLRTIGAPTVPAVYAEGTLEGGNRYVVMEFIALPTLASRLAQLSGPMPREEFSLRSRSIAEALDLLHTQGFAHCDLTPENLFLDDTASRVRIVDFGLSRALAMPDAFNVPRPAEGNTYAGTAEYMAPEQCAGSPTLDARTDVYALGVLLYEMLTGRTPFFGVQTDVLQAHLSRRPTPPSELASVPPLLEALILQCLAKERFRRFDSVAIARGALREALAEAKPVEEPPARAPSSTESSRAPQTRRSVAVLLFTTQANPLSIQKVLTGLGGQVAYRDGARFAGVFDPNAGENPVQRAIQAAEELEEQRLVSTALIDVATVTVQQRPGAPARYLGGIFTRKERYPAAQDTIPLLLTPAAADAVPHVRCITLPERGLLRLSTPEVEPRKDVTVLRLGSSVLVGRDEELQGLWESARGAVEGRAPTLTTVLGERGHGKSHFGAALARRLKEGMPRARVHLVRAREPVQGDPSSTLRMLLRQGLHGFEREVTDSGEEGRKLFFERLGTELATELWPGVAATLGWSGLDSPELQSRAAAPGALRSLALRAAGELLASIARERPLCLLLDDAHFADETALDALEYACLAEAEVPLWVCVLARPEFERSRPSWGMRAAHRATVTLAQLAPGDAQALCRLLLRPVENVPSQAVERIVERARRVPLFLVELVRALKRQGLVRQRGPGGSWYLVTDELDTVPELRLVEWLAERELNMLPPALAAHARLCALLGSDFTESSADGVVHELEREGGASGFPLDPHHATLRLLEQGLLVEHRHEALSFRNELVREAVARTLPEAERARLHRAAFRFFESRRAAHEKQQLPRLAFHAATAGMREEALALYLDLAESARGRHAYLDAETLYSRALGLLDPADELRGLTLFRGRGLMRYRIGRYDDSLADFTRARELARKVGDTRVEVEVLLDEAMALDWVNDYTRSEACVQEARALAVKVSSSYVQTRLLLGVGRSWFRQGQWEEACPPLEAAADRALTLGDAGYETRVVAQLLLAVILPNLGRISEAEAVLEDVIAACTKRGDQFHLGGAINNRRNLWVARKDLTSAIKDQERFMHLGRELGVVGWEYFAEHNLGELYYQAGDTASAAPHIARAIELERQHVEVAARPWALLLHARVLAWEGQFIRARERLGQVREALAQRRHPVGLSPSEEVLFVMVELTTREAAPEAWRQLQERSAEVSVEQEPLEVLEMMGMAALRRGDRAEAIRILEDAMQRAARIPNVMEGRLRRMLDRALTQTAG
ncbi:serine/threonine-protein kinase [Hyalangium versicolor]|uniref:serine/threonine-protein kinase n=1 Tax=Hyalangium versicolor TaxID=2861190 RepID=UPI001CCEE8E2|nr:serine/threonine-protein kinase [Hyalangium versicolor]